MLCPCTPTVRSVIPVFVCVYVHVLLQRDGQTETDTGADTKTETERHRETKTERERDRGIQRAGQRQDGET